MIITRKTISRRTVLRGLVAAVSLPLLDAMVPALTALARTPAKSVARFGVTYVPMGAVMNNWTPTETGANFALSPILEPLAAFRDRMLVLTNLDNEPAVAKLGEPAGGHGRIGGAFLTGVHAKPTEGTDFEAGISIDQIAAQHLGQQTQLASLELGLETAGIAGACDVGYSCAYVNTLCWRAATTPLPMENNPRAVFERLFGDSDSTDPAARIARMTQRRSILDSVTETVSDLQRSLGRGDGARLTEYLDSVRDVERRIQRAEADSANELPVVERPAGSIPASFEEYAKVMFDLQVLAYQSDVTRIATFMIGKELSSRTYPEIGVPDQHHPLSHHQNDPEKLAKLTRVNTFHASLVAYYLEKLRSTPDGESNLLDQLTLIYGSGMSNSNQHVPHKLPVLLLGGGAGHLKAGRHLRFADETPLTNLYLTVLNQLGVPVERIGDSSGQMRELSEVVS
jgi:hypothetical protein